MAQLKDTVISGNLRVTDTIYGHNPHYVYYVKGTQTSSTGSWTGNLPEVSALYEGLTISYWLPYAGNGNATLNLTLKDGTKTGAINIYRDNTNRLTTHIPQYAVMELIYQTVTISGTNYTGWWLLRLQDSNDRAAVIYRCSGNYKADSVIYRYQLLFQTGEYTFTPLNNANNDLGTTKTMLTNVEFYPLGEILYYEHTNTIQANGEFSNVARWSGWVDTRYTFNCGSTLTANRPLYLKVILQPNGKVKLASANPLAQELPSTNDGYLYIRLGMAYNTYQLSLDPWHKVYYHNGTEIIEYTADTKIIEEKQDLIIKSKTGDIISFNDGTNNPVTALTINVNPIQDLHGYSHPWIGGSEKNKLKSSIVGTTTINNVTFTTYNDGSVKANGTASTNADFYFIGGPGIYADTNIPTGTYKINGNSLATTTSAFYVVRKTGNEVIAAQQLDYQYNISLDSSEQYRIFIRVNDGATVTNQMYYPMICQSSISDATYMPYENICPISGHTQCDVYNDPKYGGYINFNQIASFQASRTFDSIDTTFDSTTGTMHSSGTTASNYYFIFNTSSNISYVANHKYYIKIDDTRKIMWQVNVNGTNTQVANKVGAAIVTYDNSGLLQGAVVDVTVGAQIDVSCKPQIFDLTEMFGSTVADQIYTMEQQTAGAGVAYFKSLFPNDYYAYNTGTKTNVSAVSNLSYEHITIDLNGTRYSGILNVLTGEMIIDKTIVDMGTLSWQYESDKARFMAEMPSNYRIPITEAQRKDLWSSIYYADGSPIGMSLINGTMSGYTNNKIYLYNFSYTDVTTFTSAMSGVPLLYYLDTPQTIQLTPNQLNTLLGDNNIWSSTGETSVKYWTQSSQDLMEGLDSTYLKKPLLGHLAFMNSNNGIEIYMVTK